MMPRKTVNRFDLNQPNNIFNLVKAWKDSTVNDSTLNRTFNSIPHNSYQTSSKNPYSRERRHYFLGGKFSGIYFTPQEAQCMLHLLNGCNYKKTGLAMRLSSRTVNYYCNRMREKLRCKNKKELIELVSDTDFVQNATELANKD